MRVTLVVFILLVTGPVAFAKGLGEAAPAIQTSAWLQGEPVAIEEGRLHVVDFWSLGNRVLRENPRFLNALLELPKPPLVFAVTLDDADAMKTLLQRKGVAIPRYPVALDAKKATTDAYLGLVRDRGFGDSCFVVGPKKQVLWCGPARQVGGIVAQIQAGTYTVEAFLKHKADRRQSEFLVKRYLELLAAGALQEQIDPVVTEVFTLGERHPEALIALARIILIAPGLQHRDLDLAHRAARAAWDGSQHKDARAGLFLGKSLVQLGKLDDAREIFSKALEVADDSTRRALQIERDQVIKKQGAATPDAQKTPKDSGQLRKNPLGGGASGSATTRPTSRRTPSSKPRG